MSRTERSGRKTVDYKVSSDLLVQNNWFEDQETWSKFLEDCYSDKSLNECHKCMRRFSGYMKTCDAVTKASLFFKYFQQTCLKCKQNIYLSKYNRRKYVNIPGREKLNARLFHKYVDDIVDPKDSFTEKKLPKAT